MIRAAAILAAISFALVGVSRAAIYQPVWAAAQAGFADAADRNEQTITGFGDASASRSVSFSIDSFNPNPDDQKTAVATSQIDFAADAIDMNLSLSFAAGQNAPDLMTQGEFIFDLPAATSVSFDSSGFSTQSLGLHGSSADLPTMLDDAGRVTLPAGEYDYFALLDAPLLSGTSPLTANASITLTLEASAGTAAPLPEPDMPVLLAAWAIAWRARRRKI